MGVSPIHIQGASVGASGRVETGLRRSVEAGLDRNRPYIASVR